MHLQIVVQIMENYFQLFTQFRKLQWYDSEGVPFLMRALYRVPIQMRVFGRVSYGLIKWKFDIVDLMRDYDLN